jgi:hypothetical protein
MEKVDKGRTSCLTKHTMEAAAPHAALLFDELNLRSLLPKFICRKCYW